MLKLNEVENRQTCTQESLLQLLRAVDIYEVLNVTQ